VILATTIIMSFRTFAEGMHRLNEADRRARILVVAQEQLARMQFSPHPASGTTVGRSGGFAWTLTLTPLPAKSGTPHGLSLVQVRFDIRESEEASAASYDLDTYLLAVAQ
jgi:hypothetical protein